jgi:hypothetical protein
MLRGGNDESTMGPMLVFGSNNISNCYSKNDEPLINLYGTQRSFIENNNFQNSNVGRKLILFEDTVKAYHIYKLNTQDNSGSVTTNQYVTNGGNKVF